MLTSILAEHVGSTRIKIGQRGRNQVGYNPQVSAMVALLTFTSAMH